MLIDTPPVLAVADEMKELGAPVTIDATHAVQLPGADPRSNSASTGGRRFGVPLLAKAAIAARRSNPVSLIWSRPSCRSVAATTKARRCADAFSSYASRSWTTWPFLTMSMGRLPGDMAYKSKHISIYFPLGTSILISIVLSAIFYLLLRFHR